MQQKQKLEQTRIGKEKRPRLEPHVLATDRMTTAGMISIHGQGGRHTAEDGKDAIRELAMLGNVAGRVGHPSGLRRKVADCSRQKQKVRQKRRALDTSKMVGYSGFEPLTSSMSRKRSNQLS